MYAHADPFTVAHAAAPSNKPKPLANQVKHKTLITVHRGKGRDGPQLAVWTPVRARAFMMTPPAPFKEDEPPTRLAKLEIVGSSGRCAGIDEISGGLLSRVRARRAGSPEAPCRCAYG